MNLLRGTLKILGRQKIGSVPERKLFWIEEWDDGYYVMMREPPTEMGDHAMILFMRMPKEQADHFLERLENAIKDWTDLGLDKENISDV